MQNIPVFAEKPRESPILSMKNLLKGFFAFLVLAACKLDLATELLHGELHHPLRRVHRVFELHVDVSEKSLQDH